MAQSSAAAIVFDDGKGQLGPLTDLRAAFEVRSGALTTLDRLRHELRASGVEVAGVWTSPHMAPVVRERIDLPCNDSSLRSLPTGDVLLINGRRLRLHAEVNALRVGEALLSTSVDRSDSGALLAARLTPADALAILTGRRAPESLSARIADDDLVLQRPWDIIRYRDRALDVDLAILAAGVRTGHAPSGTIFIGDRISVASGARVFPGAILDSESGSIFLDENASVRPGAIICGPAYIGKSSTVLERAHIKAHTAIGPVCKVGGEVGGCIFQGWANKAHEGHLGDSWVGEWANLGAGTTNSNLLNTYGEVTATAAPGLSRERTGLTFFGAVIGDHVKTAIMTRIMTGSVFGTGAMIAHPTPGTLVKSLEWLTPERRQSFRFEKFMEVARAAMARRQVTPGDAYAARLADLHAAGSSEQA